MIGVQYMDGRPYGSAGAVKTYSDDYRRFDQPGTAGAEVHRLTLKFQAEPKLSYEEAMNAVLANPANAELKHAYAMLG